MKEIDKLNLSEDEKKNLTGDVWDNDLVEATNPMPRWWVNLFFGLTIFAIVYMLLYPSIPIGKRYFKGILGWTSVKQYNDNVNIANKRFIAKFSYIKTKTVEQLANDPKVINYAITTFKDNCAACHGEDAGGAYGYPNLTDNVWLWGGTGDAIYQTIANGRQGIMPKKGLMPNMNNDQIKAVTEYVYSLSHSDIDSGLADKGKPIFMRACAACHQPTGKGRIALAPNLTDNDWLYGGSRKEIEKTIRNGRHGIMPAWKAKLGPDKVKMLAAYVYSLSHSR